MDTPVSLVITVWDVAARSVADQRVADGSVIVLGACHWIAHFGPECEGPYPNTSCVRLEADRLYRIDLGGIRSFYTYQCSPGVSGTAFCPTPLGPQPDVTFYVDYLPEDSAIPEWSVRVVPHALPSDQETGVDTWLPGGQWTLPYDAATIRARAGFDPDVDLSALGWVFMTPSAQTSGVPPVGLKIPLTGSVGADWRVPAGRTFSWSSADVSGVHQMGAGGRITVKGTFNASGLTFTASNPAQGWLGIRYNPGSGGTLSGTSAQPTVVERVTGGCAPNTCFTSGVDAAITVESASPTFNNVTIRDPAAGTYLHGVRVMGPNASPLATGLSVSDITGSAVYAHAGATPELRGLYVNLTRNQEAAVFAAGAGTHVRLVAAPSGGVLRGPQMTGGFGGGVQATSLAQVSFSGASGGLGFANIDGNAGRGLSATGDADLFAGTTAVQSRNRILFNGGTSATGNGRASGTGSTVSARCNWWGQADPALFRIGAVSGATFNANRWLTGDPYLDPDVPCVNANGAAARSAATPLGRAGGAGATAGVDGGSTSPADWLADAMELAPADQLAALIALIAEQPGTPEAASALSVAGALATAEATPAGVAAGAVALLDSYAESSSVETLQRAALGALVGVRLGTGDAAGALAAADALVALGGGAARTGHAARVFVHGADDTAASLDALAALDAGWPGSDEADAARAHLAALGVAVPGNRATAGGSDILDDVPAEASAVVSNALATALAVSPNPSAAGAVVTLTLADAADVHVAVYDLVGREVAVLLAGEAAAGSHAARVPAGLAPGAYVVRAVTAGVVVAMARLVVVR